MATDVELESMIVRLVGDGTSYKRMLKTAEADTNQFAVKAEGRMEAMHQHHDHINHRALHRLAHIGVALPNIATAEKGIHVAEHGAMAVGMMFGTQGFIIGAVIGGVIAGVERLNDALGNKGTEAANKAFGAMAKGGKTAQQAIGEISLDTLRKSAQDMQDWLNPATPLAKFRLFLTAPWWKDPAMWMQKANKEIQEQEEGMETLQKSASARAGLETIYVKAFRYHALDLDKDIELQKRSIGMTDRRAKMEKELMEAERDFANVKQPVPQVIKDRLKGIFDNETFVAGKKMQQSLQESVQWFGKTAEEIELLKLKNDGLNPAILQTIDSLMRQRDALKLGVTVRAFRAEMDGATKGQLAFMREVNDSQKPIARQNALMQEALQIRQSTMLPTEKLAQSHRDLSEVLGAGLITQDMYNRAMEKEIALVRGESAAIQGAAKGSAEALERKNKYLEDVNRYKYVPPALQTGAVTPPAAGSTEAKTALEQAAAQMKRAADALQAIADKPGTVIKPAGVK